MKRRSSAPRLQIQVPLGRMASAFLAMMLEPHVRKILAPLVDRHALELEFDVVDKEWVALVNGIETGAQFERLQELAYAAREFTDAAVYVVDYVAHAIRAGVQK